MLSLSKLARVLQCQGLRRVGVWAAMLISASLLASCGGSEAPGATTPAPALPKLMVSLSDSSGANRNTLAVASPLTATAVLVDATGRPIVNSLVQFSLSFAGTPSSALLSPESGSGITDANGKFSVTLYAAKADAEGGGTITVTAANLADAAPASVAFQVIPVSPPPQKPTLSLTLADPTTGAAGNTLTRTTPLQATATVVDAGGRPVVNSQVQFALTFAGSSATAVLAPESGSGITDANGQFSVALIAVNSAAEGSGTITATAIGQSDVPPASASFQVVPTSPPAVAPTVTLALTDPSSGADRNTLTLATPLNATATLVDAGGRPIPSSLIQFSLTTAGGGAPVAVFSPASGTGITDASGKLTVTLAAAGLTAQGAGTLTATAVNEKGAPAATSSFQVGATSISLGNITRTPESIEPLQTATITAAVSGVPASVPVTVRFASSCASSGLALLPASVVTVNGVATAVYTDKGCSGQDAITISADGAASVQTSINILQAPPVAIQFVSAAPEVIAVAGSGGQPSSVVVFKAVNAAQQAVANLPVTLSLSTAVGDVKLDGQSGPITKQTAQDGTVRVNVVAGTQPGPVRVVATAAGGLSTVSSVLTIQTGLPVQSRFSLSFQTFNIEGWNVDGTSTSVTIRAADRVGNPVPDNTVVNFRTSGALIEPSCRTTNGACSVTFRSQANRPPSGRVAILAWAVGEETFLDADGNNRYDANESFGDLGDAFVDTNLDGVYQQGEEYIAFNPAATSACAAGSFSAAGRPGSCDGIWGLAHVRASGQIVLSGSTPFASLPSTIILRQLLPETCAGTLQFVLADVNGNPMPAGTAIVAELTPSRDGDEVKVFGSPVASALAPTTVAVDLSVSAPASSLPDTPASCRGDAARNLRITVTTPLGAKTTLAPVTVIY